MIIKGIEIEQFRAFEHASFYLGKRLTAISGRNATQKTTVLGMIGQPFTISLKEHVMYGCKTIDGYNFKSQFKEKFKISPVHDVIGQHKWKLLLHNNITDNNYFSMESIPRKSKGKEPTLRFWNAMGRAKGEGYIQLPVYFLSLSRLFPIGEIGKTASIPSELTKEELEYCIKNYRTILSIQGKSIKYSIDIEKSSASKTFTGISDDIHDIFTNSAGEGNILKIILAVLSFKRLRKKYGKDYKGGILLIDELDATLYEFSQIKLVEYLWNASAENKLQIVFTTHSPIILKKINKYQRKELQQKGIDLPIYAYDSSIVYLEPQYDNEGKRTIMPKNITTSMELNRIINDINLSIFSNDNQINVYCEDMQAIDFVKFILKDININLDAYMKFIDINLGWPNYVQLYEKEVPEFRNNIIILDGDVPENKDYKKKANTIASAENFLFLPLVIERDIFTLLKQHSNFSEFLNNYCNSTSLTYDICFNNWPLDASDYSTIDFKNWFKYIKDIVGRSEVLFEFWIHKYKTESNDFIRKFINVFNILAERKDIDGLPISNSIISDN